LAFNGTSLSSQEIKAMLKDASLKPDAACSERVKRLITKLTKTKVLIVNEMSKNAYEGNREKVAIEVFEDQLNDAELRVYSKIPDLQAPQRRPYVRAALFDLIRKGRYITPDSLKESISKITAAEKTIQVIQLFDPSIAATRIKTALSKMIGLDVESLNMLPFFDKYQITGSMGSLVPKDTSMQMSQIEETSRKERYTSQNDRNNEEKRVDNGKKVTDVSKKKYNSGKPYSAPNTGSRHLENSIIKIERQERVTPFGISSDLSGLMG
jgi:hypothetical protein